MAAISYVSAIIAPALAWIVYFYYKDRFKPEPWRNLGLAYLFGLIAALACVFFFKLLTYLRIPDDPSVLMEAHGWPFLIYSIAITGLVEEFFKFLPFLLFVLRLKDFDEIIDGIVYASVIALGFASYENARYLAYMEGFALFGRAIASPLTHTIFSSIWGYAVGTAHMRRRSIAIASIRGLAIAAIVHGLFNFFTTSAALRIVSSLLILVVWIWRIRAMESLCRKKDP